MKSHSFLGVGASSARISFRVNRLVLSALLFVAGLAQSEAASVGPSGYTNNFTLQPLESDWATLGVPGSAGDITNANQLDAAVQLLNATELTGRCAASDGNPADVSGVATWSSAGYLQTRPSAVGFTALMAALVNETGTNATSIRISYDFSQAAPTNEQVEGYAVYFSLTGSPGTWALLPSFYSAPPGRLSTNLALVSPWLNGTTLYLLWADENGLPYPDAACQIDNFYIGVTAGAPSPLLVSLTSPASGLSLPAPAALDLATTVRGGVISGVGFFSTNNGWLAASLTAPYLIRLSGLGSGTYGFYVVATNNLGMTTFSATNIVIATNIPLSVALATPVDGQLFFAPAGIPVLAATSGTFPATKVAFYTNNVLFAISSSVPFSSLLSLSTAGSYAIHAVATNSIGQFAFSTTNTFTVRNPFISYGGGTIFEDFNDLGSGPGPSLLPVGWWVGAATNAQGPVAEHTVSQVGDGTANGVGFWNLGLPGDQDRALGSQAGSGAGGDLNMEIRIRNDTGQNITNFTVRYDGEQWRANGVTEAPQSLVLYYSTNGVSFVPVSPMFTFTSLMDVGTAALDGDLFANRTANIGGVYTPSAPVPPGGTIYLRWYDTNNAGADHQMAIDNFTFFAPIPTPVSILVQPATHEVPQGETASVSIRASGYPISYQWYKNGVAIIDATNDSLSVLMADRSDTATYFVTISNKFGWLASSNAVLAVRGRLSGLFHTGVDDSNTPLTDGEIDPHYILATNAASSSTSSIVHDSTVYPIVTGPWLYNNSTSKWIAPRLSTASLPAGLYVYRTGFDLSGCNPQSVVLKGSWAAGDYGVVIRVNGVACGAWTANSPYSLSSFAINGSAAAFKEGANTLDFVVRNDDSQYTGLRVEDLEATAVLSNSPIRIVTQPQNAAGTEGQTIALSVEVSGYPRFYQWFKDGLAISRATNASLVAPGCTTNDAGNYFVIVSNLFNSATSTVARLSVFPDRSVPAVRLDDSWKYNQSGKDLGTAWKESDYDDSTWSSGRAVLALEDNTAVPPLTNTVLSLTNAAGTRIVTYYFRTHFFLTNDPRTVFLTTSNLVDDGGIVYLNGAEIYRLNMPPGPVNSSTLASNAVEGGFVLKGFVSSNLAMGDNVLAVEVHQTATTSSDIVFGLSVTARPLDSNPCMIFGQPESVTTIESEAVLFGVGVSGTPLFYQWLRNGNPILAATNATLSIPSLTADHAGVYSVMVTDAYHSVVSTTATLSIVGLGGYTNDFSAQPHAVEWSTLSIPGSNAQCYTEAQMDAEVAMIAANLITNKINISTSTPPDAEDLALWSSPGQYLATRPHTNVLTLLMATVYNATALRQTNIEVSYDFTAASSMTEELPGYRVYYSLTGLPDSWVKVPSLNMQWSQHVTAVVPLASPWNPGAPLFLLWADDNGNYYPDTSCQIDNFYVPGAIARLPAGRIDAPVRSGQLLAGDALRFSGRAVGLATGQAFQYAWDFGDGRSSSRKDPGLLSFPSPGERIVTLGLLDNNGHHSGAAAGRTFAVVSTTDPVPDLAAQQMYLPTDLSINQVVQIPYSVQNIGDAGLSGRTWMDAVYLSADSYLDATDQLLGATPVSENVPAGGAYTNIIEVTIPGMAEGSYHLILSVNDEWRFLERYRLNNELAEPTDLAMPRLTNGVALAGSFSANGDMRYYRVDVAPGQNLFVRLNDADNQGMNELYARFGALPSRGQHDYRATAPGSADQQLLISGAAPGTWYILAYGASVPSGKGAYAIGTSTSPLEVAAVTPNHSGNFGSAVLTLTGAGFDATSIVGLIGADGKTYEPLELSVDSYTQMTVTFSMVAVPVGLYSVRVYSPLWGASLLANAFQVLPGGEAKLETNLILPQQLGYHAVATIYVEYRNSGTLAMPAPLLVLNATQNGVEGAFLSLQETRLVEGFWTSAMPDGFSHSVQFLASGETPGVLQPGESGRVPVYYVGWQQPWDFGYPPFQFRLGVLKADDTTPVDWSSLKGSMKPASTSSEVWDALWKSFTSRVGSTWGDYLKMLDDNAAYLGRLGQRVLDVGQLVAFEFLQADGLNPFRTLASAVDASVEAPGLPLAFTRSFPQPISQRLELGSLGRGWYHNWQYSLLQASDGTVTVVGPGGSKRIFKPDTRLLHVIYDQAADGADGGKSSSRLSLPVRGAYFSSPGDHGSLYRFSGDVPFVLREQNGLQRRFYSDGRLHSVSDLNGNKIIPTYGGNLPTRLTHSSGQYLDLSYNGVGRIQSVTDHLGRQTLFTYDAANEHLIGAHYHDGRVAEYYYNSTPGSTQHSLAQAGGSCCARRYFDYDALGRLTGTHLEDNAEPVVFSYYSPGKVVVTDALGSASKFCFDHRALLVKTEDALGNTVHRSFDDQYNLLSLTDPGGHSYNYGYDGAGNLTRSTDPLGHTTRFGYAWIFNRLSSVTDANGNLTKYNHNNRGNLLSVTHADSSREGWAYDTNGDAITWTNRRGHPIHYTYDPAGRLTGKFFADGSRMTYAHDTRGNLTNASVFDAETNLTEFSLMAYDAGDRLTNITYPGGRWLAFTYDSAGRRASSLDQLGHRLTYHYDPAGRLASMTNEVGQMVVRYAYDPAGRMAIKTVGNGVLTTYQYDPAGQVLSLSNFLAGGTVLSRFNYTYDTRGRRTSMDTLDGRWTYGYDHIGQLIRAVFASTTTNIPNQDLTYVYDALGNRIRTIENGVTTEYTANNMNRYVRVGTTNYLFDADGNMIQEITPQGINTFTYNEENRLIAVSKGTGLWLYGYNALNSRVTKVENGTKKRFVVDPIGLGNAVGEYAESGALLARYDHDVGLVSFTTDVDGPSYYVLDAIGNVHQLITSDGETANAYAYGPFGTPIRKAEKLPNPFQFVGDLGVMSDGNQLHFMRARYYSPDQGRFTASDPFGIAGGMNLNGYCGNNPVDFVDPLGLDRTIRFLGHFWMEVDKYDESGRVTGKVMVDLAPRLRLGHPGADWRIGDPTEAAGGLRGLPLWHVQSGKAADEALMNMWREQKERDNVGWNPGYNCAVAAFQFVNYGTSGTTGSSDPNIKTGIAGFGTNGYILPGSLLSYRIDFENDTNASAPAQTVEISDLLDESVELSTFALTEIGFGDTLVAVPPNSQYFETIEPMNFGGVDFEVYIQAGLDLEYGMVYATFMSIDPFTELPPEVSIGFLPPEDGTGRGQGHLSYTVRAKSNLPTGTQIRNVALITFDRGQTIATDAVDPHDPGAGTDPTKQTLNTIDADTPASTVSLVPETFQGTNFAVAWSGTDVGSGVASYDIYVSDDGGPWSLWMSDLVDSVAIFGGQYAHTYSFVSQAEDNVGNVELWPAAPKAVVTIPPPALHLRLTNHQAVVSWPRSASGFLLEATTHLEAERTPWTIVTNTPVPNTDQQTVTLPCDAATRFFRLRRP